MVGEVQVFSHFLGSLGRNTFVAVKNIVPARESVKNAFSQIFKRTLPVLEPEGWIKPQDDQHPKDLGLLIGDTITDIRHYYEPHSINGWLDCSTTYIALEKNGLVSFPISGDDTFLNVAMDPRAEEILPRFMPLIIGRKIVNIHYYFDEEGLPDESHLSFFELDNGYYVTENTVAPHGTGQANLFTYSTEEFREIVKKSSYVIAPWKETF